jgi:hypothetical protein
MVSFAPPLQATENSRLAFEIFHNVKESVVHIGLVGKLDFDLIKIAKRILYFC